MKIENPFYEDKQKSCGSILRRPWFETRYSSNLRPKFCFHRGNFIARHLNNRGTWPVPPDERPPASAAVLDWPAPQSASYLPLAAPQTPEPYAAVRREFNHCVLTLVGKFL